MPTAASATIADLTRRLTTLRITGLSANDPVILQAALDDGEVEVCSRLGGGAFPAYASLTATGKAIFQGFTLEYAYFVLAERLGKLDDSLRADRERLDERVEAYRARGAGLEALGDPPPISPRVGLVNGPAVKVWTRTSMGSW
jgi:DNA-binding IclR family transcriptional regulator